MTAATSASDRYAESRVTLGAFEKYMDHFDADEFAPEIHALAESMRVLIEPPAVEHPNLRSIEAAAFTRALPNDNGPYTGEQLGEATIAAREAVYQAGIQAAWESWEPENAPGHRGTMTRAQIEDAWDRAEVPTHIDYDFLRDFVTNLGIEAV